LFNGDGHDYLSEVGRVGKKEVILEVKRSLAAAGESWLKITVVQALSRGERMDQTLQKCTELGAACFQPLISERIELHLRGEKLEKRLQHWQGVVISACEQSGRAVVPEVLPPRGIDGWLDRSCSGRRYVLDPAAEEAVSRADIPGHLELAVGPEGGFSAAELARMQSCGVQGLSLGPRVLRTETAAAAAVAVLQARAGDF